MKREYEDVAFDRIKTLKQEIDTYINRLGSKKLIHIFVDRFGISNNDATRFLSIIEEMRPGVPFDAIPHDWFFDPGHYSFQPLRSMRRKIREERIEIINTIKSYWKLSEEVQSNNIELWPEEWRKHLMKEKIFIGDEKEFYSAEEANSEVVVYNAPEIANLILSKRYKIKPSTINSYSKPEKID